jgi:hypothetical protein
MRCIVKIHLLYFNDCPSWQSGLENLKTALQFEGLDTSVVLVKVEDNDAADRLKFLGSPSFQINGQDLWPEARDSYSLSCRIYSTPDGMRGYPTVEMLRKKLITLEGDLQ